MFPVPWSSRWSWSLHLFLGRPMFLRLFGLYFSACFGSLFVSILCTFYSHFFWYCFISFTLLCAPVFCLIHWFFSLSSFVIPSKCLENFICAASKRCSLYILYIYIFILLFHLEVAFHWTVNTWSYFLNVPCSNLCPEITILMKVQIFFTVMLPILSISFPVRSSLIAVPVNAIHCVAYNLAK